MIHNQYCTNTTPIPLLMIHYFSDLLISWWYGSEIQYGIIPLGWHGTWECLSVIRTKPVGMAIFTSYWNEHLFKQKRKHISISIPYVEFWFIGGSKLNCCTFSIADTHHGHTTSATNGPGVTPLNHQMPISNVKVELLRDKSHFS